VVSNYNDFVVLQLECCVDEKLLIGIYYRSTNNLKDSDEELYSLMILICNKFNCKKNLGRTF